MQGAGGFLEGKKEAGTEAEAEVEPRWDVSEGRWKDRKGRKDCSQSLHTPTFITGWVVQLKGTGGIV